MRFRDRLSVLVGGGNRVPVPSAGAGCGTGGDRLLVLYLAYMGRFFLPR